MQINIQKRHALIILAAAVLLVVAGYVMAVANPNPGHSIDELPDNVATKEYVNQIAEEADNKCDTSAECTQLCINEDCRNAWPVDTDTIGTLQCTHRQSNTARISGHEVCAPYDEVGVTTIKSGSIVRCETESGGGFAPTPITVSCCKIV